MVVPFVWFIRIFRAKGQRHIEPFISMEAQIAAICSQAYLFDADIEKELVVSPLRF
jgi:hypothetical protein